MGNFVDNLKKIYLEQKGLIVLMGVVLVISIGLLIFSLVNLQVSSSVVKIGYGDIGMYQGGAWSSMANSGGYRDGAWSQMFAFAILAVIYGALHNLLAVKLYEKKGASIAKMLAVFTICLVVFTFVVEIRLLAEG